MSNTLKYTPEQYKFAKIYRDTAYPSYETTLPWAQDQTVRDNWVEVFLERLDNVNHPKETEEIHKLYKEDNTMTEKTETASNQYSFVSAEEDIDYDRILRETPKGTLFILVEERTRDNQAENWSLFVHNTVLTNPEVKGVSLGSKETYHVVTTIGPEWGYNYIENFNGKVDLHSYRVVSGPGAVPGYVRKKIDYIKRSLNPKNRKTVVTLF